MSDETAMETKSSATANTLVAAPGSLDDTLIAADEPGAGSVASGEASAESAAPPSRHRYAYGAVLGRGGMGEVVAARDRHLDRDIAIKRLHGRRDAAALVRFLREARIQARLEHPAIAPIHELDRDEHGHPFLVMKRIKGATLADTITRVDRGDPVAMHRLLTTFGQVCHAIDYAHEKGVVHRDLKPANIILGDHGDVYVLDWGVARVLGDTDAAVHRDERDATAHGSGSITGVGGVVGTPGYMAPEQIEGREIDTRVDVYALGCVLFEILAGVPMHPHDRMLQPLLEEERRPSRRGAAVAPELDDLCVHATARDPRERTASARALHGVLDRYLAGDRDLARRRELAAACVGAAEVALSGGDGVGARSTAMREASQALALDPNNARARALVARLLLKPPAEVPAEVVASLAASRGQRIKYFGRVGVATYLGILLFVPFALWMGLRRPWLLVAFTLIAAAGIGSAAQCVNGRGGRWSPYAVMIAGACLVALTSRIFSSFAIAPLLAFGWASISFVHPARLSVPAIVAAFSVATLAPPLLEAGGVIASTGRFKDGVLVIDNAGLWLRQAPTLVTFGTIIVVGLVLMANILVKMRRKLEEEEKALALQAWQLERGLPSGMLEESREG